MQEIKRSRYLELRFSTNLRLWWLRNILQLYGFGARGPILTQVTPGARVERNHIVKDMYAREY
jgi:hypothetical protein